MSIGAVFFRPLMVCVCLVSGFAFSASMGLHAADVPKLVAAPAVKATEKTPDPVKPAAAAVSVAPVSRAMVKHQPDLTGFNADVAPFFRKHCVSCHGAEKPEGDLSLHKLDADIASGRDAKTWEKVLEQLSSGEMPPEDKPRPDAKSSVLVIKWIRAELTKSGRAMPALSQMALPSHGNRVPHDQLFGKPAGAVVPPPSRVWRLSPSSYDAFVKEVVPKDAPGTISQPFSLIPGKGIKDYAAAYTIDEPGVMTLLRNAEEIVLSQTAFVVKDGKVHSTSKRGGAFMQVMDERNPPTDEQIRQVIAEEFRQVMRRGPSTDELQRFVELMKNNVETGGQVAGARATLTAIVLMPEAMFRMELGEGPVDAQGRRALAPRELATALSYALGDHRNDGLLQAADKGELATREQAAALVLQLLNDPKAKTTRIHRFFREYFGYGDALEVFKDPPPTDNPKVGNGKHAHPAIKNWEPGILVSDTDRLVGHIVNLDKNVLHELLTTSKSFASYKFDEETKKASPTSSHDRWMYMVYNLPVDWRFVEQQPFELPAGQRFGILTQPSWLAAHSGNFDNDAIRRGKWIREKLLGGTIPDLPIGVQAVLPDHKDKTLRERMSVTRAEACWKCHQRMDDLGLPFEQFDHYGRWRATEKVHDAEAMAKNVDEKGKPKGVVWRDAPLVTTGGIEHVGDSSLEGPAGDPIALIKKLAGSPRVEQVFVRHAFRFFLGRNETVDDARTLQGAHKIYSDSGGSFKALVVSLLTSDSFIYRSDSSPGGLPAKGAPAHGPQDSRKLN